MSHRSETVDNGVIALEDSYKNNAVRQSSRPRPLHRWKALRDIRES